MRLPLRVALVACLAGLISGPKVWACSTPVFRYALERWQPDPYLVLILHREPLDRPHQQLIGLLQDAAADKEAPANLSVQMVDLSKSADEATRILVEDMGVPQHSPWMLVRYPTAMNSGQPITSGPMNEAAVRSLIDSPARREIVDRIVAGDSAVWVLIESGDESENDSAQRVLERQLGRLEKTLKLPEPMQDSAQADSDSGTATEVRAGPLKFSLLRVARNDPAEAFFVSMLVNSEPGLEQHPGPVAIPVFGRGRSHYALAGKGINAENIERSCAFLAGACSCEIKSQNPGGDLLMRANWDQLLGNLEFDVDFLPELTALGPIRDAVVKLEATTSPTSPETESAAAISPIRTADRPIIPDAPTAAPTTSRLPAYLPAVGVVLGGLLVVLIGTWVIKARQAPAG